MAKQAWAVALGENAAAGLSAARSDLHLWPSREVTARCYEIPVVSVNTLYAQLQRIFDKTGLRSEAAWVRSLL